MATHHGIYELALRTRELQLVVIAVLPRLTRLNHSQKQAQSRKQTEKRGSLHRQNTWRDSLEVVFGVI